MLSKEQRIDTIYTMNPPPLLLLFVLHNTILRHNIDGVFFLGLNLSTDFRIFNEVYLFNMLVDFTPPHFLFTQNNPYRNNTQCNIMLIFKL